MAPVLRMLVLAFALLQTAPAADLSDTVFVVTVSSRVEGGKQETLCAQVHGPPNPVNLTVALETDSSRTVLLQEDVTADFYRCFSFQVPVVRSRTVATVNVTIQGGGAPISMETKISIEPPAFIHLIQTDKPLYKLGQTVQFRIVSMDVHFIPVDRVYNVVALQDPNSNRIAQWLNKTVASGILDLAHRVIPEAAQGTYTITASTDQGEQISHSFDIKEYVLPKYEVEVHLPGVISILDQQVTLRICGKYTYGKPVVGSVKAVFCKRLSWYYPNGRQTDPCKTYEMTTDKSGCATQTVDLKFSLKGGDNTDFFDLTAELQEFGTGVVLKGGGRSTFSRIVRKVTFKDLPTAYKTGIPLEGKVKMVGADGKALANEAVYLFHGSHLNLTLTTDSRGVASFSLDTTLWTDTVHLVATSRKEKSTEPNVAGIHITADQRVAPFYSRSSSFLKLVQVSGKLACDQDQEVRARYIIQGEELKKEQEVLHFFYLVMSRGGIVQHGRVPVAVKAGTVNKGEVSVSLRQVTGLAPVAQVVVYTVMPGGEVVADSHNFRVKLCLNNKVSLKFSSLQELPAGRTTLGLQAHPGSLCSVRAVDLSVLLLQREQELTVDSVYSRLPLQKLSGYASDVSDPASCFIWPKPEPGMVDDVYSVFKEIGIKIVTNSDVKKPQNCFEIEMVYYYVEQVEEGIEYDALLMNSEMEMSAGEQKNKKEEVVVEKKETVRTFFPETWIWDLVPVGDSGSVDVEKTVPDTVTKWAAGAFCVSSVGFGVAPNAELTAFQPFFVSLTLPYSVIRGEVFTLKATVFNYLSKCIMVNVSLAESDQYDSRRCDGCRYRACLCGEESRTFSWVLTPTALGRVDLKVSAEALRTDLLCGNEVAVVPEAGQVDSVVRSLLVEAEGTPQMVSHNALLCPEGGPVEKNVSLVMPEVFVSGSARASVSVVGDLMGRALKNLDQLLAMPYGCGEQNMLLFAPNVFILDYLRSTNQLTQEVQSRATRFLEAGYQRELTYKHDDGSFSAFGKTDESGNTWLTSFVMKSFGGARPYIFMDDAHIGDARRWLSRLQQPNGCVRSVGRLIHNGMKGGVSDDVSLTAYITAALLELHAKDPMVQGCLTCLKEAMSDQLENLYTSALMSYTFALAGDKETKAVLLARLHQKSSTEGGGRHWSRAGASGKGPDSLEVEMTSYVLLALLSGPAVPGFGLEYSSDIVRWLVQQQNPYGGFSSTQDTVVALQALAKYGAATYSQEGVTTVTVTSSGGPSREFTVGGVNRLLYQEEELSQLPGEYSLRAHGQSCVLAQVSMHYNIPPPPDFSSFNVSTSVMPNCNISRPQLVLYVHFRYQGKREETNMVIINIKLLSGFILDQSSLKLLKSDRSMKRVDVEEGFINIYLDGLKKDETKVLSVTVEQDVAVRNLKPAVVKVYDYYQTSDEAVTDYTSPCAQYDAENEL
ncbi:a2ml1 [Pungitius sinensis]